MAKTPRTWTGARTPSGLKRVRQAQSRHEVLQPRRTAAKTYVAKALSAAAQPADSTIDPVAALAEALSALDRAAKVGAIHPNAAARRKSRLTLKVNAALGGDPRHDRWPRRQDDRQGRRGQGRQGPHRRRQGRQGQGRPDRCRQGPRRAEQDGPRRGCRRQGRCRRGQRHDRRRQAGRREDGDQGRPRRRRPRATAAKKPAATKAAPKATAKAAPKKKAATKK